MYLTLLKESERAKRDKKPRKREWRGEEGERERERESDVYININLQNKIIYEKKNCKHTITLL